MVKEVMSSNPTHWTLGSWIIIASLFVENCYLKRSKMSLRRNCSNERGNDIEKIFLFSDLEKYCLEIERRTNKIKHFCVPKIVWPPLGFRVILTFKFCRSEFERERQRKRLEKGIERERERAQTRKVESETWERKSEKLKNRNETGSAEK